MRQLLAVRTDLSFAPRVALIAFVSVIGGCGVSTTEVGVGDSISVGVHRARSGHVAVDVKIGGRTCEVTRVAVSWEGGAARVNAC